MFSQHRRQFRQTEQSNYKSKSTTNVYDWPTCGTKRTGSGFPKFSTRVSCPTKRRFRECRTLREHLLACFARIFPDKAVTPTLIISNTSNETTNRKLRTYEEQQT